MKVATQKTMNVQDPTRAHATDAGLDLYVPEGQGCLVRPGAVYTINLGVRVAIPDGHYGQLTLRSSAGKKGLTMPHGVGIIDSGYRGDLKLLVTALTDPVLVAAGDRVCQLIVLPLPAVEFEPGIVGDTTDRGTGGFGSTDGNADGALYDGEYDTGEITVGKLIGMLQSIARNYGDQVPVTASADGPHHYEQIAAPLIRYADRVGVPGSQDAFDLNSKGDTIVVLSQAMKETDMEDRINLTVGGLMRALQDIAFRFGNDTPIVLPSSADADYEQATAPIIMHARREPMPDDWDLFHVDPTGKAVAVIS
jgi:hypothetical protein